MTFTEAAIEVLRREGKPLHFKKIAEIAARENLLDHVGKVPEDTMADQLAAHCRLPHPERRLWAVQQGTFALAEWGLEEDPTGFENLIEPPPEGEPPYRGRERHPTPSRELARASGRGEGRGEARGEGRARRREEAEERRGKRFPPPAEVAYEILAGAGRPLTFVDIAGRGAERLLMPDAFVRDHAALAAALAEDNRRREAAGRMPLFQVEGETVTLVAQPEPGERITPVPARAATSPADLRRAALAALRRRLRECDAPTVEHVAVALLEKLGFRELKVARRGREHVIYTGRRKLGLMEVRHAVRVLRTGADASRRDVTDLRRDLGHYGAQIGVVVTAGEAARDARGDASAAGQVPVLLLCGEALAEAFADAAVGCVPVVVPEVDEGFFKAAAEAAEKEEAARRARREERERREERGAPAPAPAATEPVAVSIEGAPGRPAAEAGPTIVVVPAELPAEKPVVVATEVAATDEEGEEGPEGEEEDAEPAAEAGPAAENAPGEPGERRRRRRRRRRRGGRGRGREGAAGAGGAPGSPEGGAPAAAPGVEAATPTPSGEAQAAAPAVGSAPTTPASAMPAGPAPAPAASAAPSEPAPAAAAAPPGPAPERSPERPPPLPPPPQGGEDSR